MVQAELAGAVTSERELQSAQGPANEWEVWDSKRSLFDNHMSTSFEKNLEYMYKAFGVHFPDWEYLQDPEGLLQYGAGVSFNLLSSCAPLATAQGVFNRDSTPGWPVFT